MSQLPTESILPGDEPIHEDNALPILIDILSNYPIWQKEPRVKICCKVIGARMLEQDAKIDGAISILMADS